MSSCYECNMCAATRASRRNPDTPDTIANNTSAIQQSQLSHCAQYRQSMFTTLTWRCDIHDKLQHRIFVTIHIQHNCQHCVNCENLDNHFKCDKHVNAQHRHNCKHWHGRHIHHHMSCPSSITIIIKCMTCVDAYCGYFHNLNTLESSTFMVGCHKVHSHHNHDNRRIDDIMIVDATHIQLIHMEPSEIPSTNNSTVSPNALMHLLLFRATRDHRRVVCGRARARDQPTTHN